MPQPNMLKLGISNLLIHNYFAYDLIPRGHVAANICFCFQNNPKMLILLKYSGNGSGKISLKFADVSDSGGTLTFDLPQPRGCYHKVAY